MESSILHTLCIKVFIMFIISLSHSSTPIFDAHHPALVFSICNHFFLLHKPIIIVIYYQKKFKILSINLFLYKPIPGFLRGSCCPMILILLPYLQVPDTLPEPGTVPCLQMTPVPSEPQAALAAPHTVPCNLLWVQSPALNSHFYLLFL